MAYKKFNDFTVFDPPDVSDYLVGYRELGGEFRSTIQDLTLIFKRLAIPFQPSNVYVSLSVMIQKLEHPKLLLLEQLKEL